MKTYYYDYLIIGAGIIGLSIARELKSRFLDKSVAVIEKEKDAALHASGRNSGVLHAGFYYPADSLKARFTREGNRALTHYCEANGLKINKCGKLVVATNEEDLQGLNILKERGELNGVELHWVDEEKITEIDSNARTFKRALYSPTTATIDPFEVCQTIKKELINAGVEFHFETAYQKQRDYSVFTNKGIFHFGYLINAAGLYADKIAHDYHFGKQYTILPFKGIYLKYDKNKDDIVTNIYPVPNLGNPFLGVHFTKTVDGAIKIGPTAIPAFWRENYENLKNLKIQELIPILFYQSKLFLTNSFQFRKLAFEEIKKYNKDNFIRLSERMVKYIDNKGFSGFGKPGIRAQLLNKSTLELVQDFVVEGDGRSLHVLNAVSPAFTCSFPFSKYIMEMIIRKTRRNNDEGYSYKV